VIDDRDMVLPDEARFVAEQPKDDRTRVDDSGRSPYARDRARVLHSAAFRRLAAKTQVHPHGGAGGPSEGFLRTRLTHSLEVAQIAREMGESLGCDPDVVDTAGLAHDLGHPPFGHNGEETLNDVSQACGGFEGNAQTLRVITRLEAKVVGPDGTPAGLNLTRASLDAACKYPWARQAGQRKFGVYADDEPVFTWLRPSAAGGIEAARRCLEAQVMDWADDVAYSVHDVEDGIIAGYVGLDLLIKDVDERAALCADVAEVYSTEPPSQLVGALDDLLADPVLAAVADFDGSSGALVAVKRASSLLIGRFASAAVSATRQEYGYEPLARYDADLVVPAEARAQCALLKGIALRYVMRRPGSESRYEGEQAILRELVSALVLRGPDALDPVFAPLWRQAPDDTARLRVIIDQVASLTDASAVAWHARLPAQGIAAT
jgi:dGTPase